MERVPYPALYHNPRALAITEFLQPPRLSVAGLEYPPGGLYDSAPFRGVTENCFRALWKATASIMLILFVSSETPQFPGISEFCIEEHQHSAILLTHAFSLQFQAAT